MKRLRLSAKLALAIIPIGLVALLAAGFIAFTFLGNSREQNETAHAATVAADAIETLKAVWDEEGQARQVYLLGNDDRVDDLASAIERTDSALQDLRDSTSELQGVTSDFFGEVAFSASADVRRVSDTLNAMRSINSPDQDEIQGYHDVASAILAVLPKTSSIVSDRLQARELSTAYYLAEGGQVSLIQEELIEQYRASVDPEATDLETSTERAGLQSTLEVLESEFGAWALRANQTANQRSAAILRYTRLPAVNIDTFPLRRNEDILNTSENMAQGVADESQLNAADSQREAYLVAGVAAIVLLIALWGSYAVIRSVVRRVRGVTKAAVRVSEEDLPALVDALQNPSEDIADLKPTRIEAAGSDEVGDLAASFTTLHSTLIDVASQQMDILRKGVSEIFVTLARRNRSLVDRQLALLDELESREEDPETLGGYYSLDHLATRMRRNAESLLVLAGSEPTRIWSQPLEVSEIIRAALGEVDDYQRVDIMALEPALVSGRAVADVAHLMSELLDNGTQFSSPSDRVRVAGLYDPDGYMLTVSDSGIGMSKERIAEFNALLANPPVLGLALQPTLGMYVVARLAARHGVTAQLISGSPGVTVRVFLPKALIEPAPVWSDADTGVETSPLPESVQYKPAGTLAMSNGAQRAESVPVPLESQATVEPVSAPDRPPSLPGKVKGRHEHPARSRSIKTDSDMDVPSSSPSPFADESGSSTRFGELKRRVPGEALSLEQQEELARDGQDGSVGRASFESDRPARFADEDSTEGTIVEEVFPPTVESEHSPGEEVEPMEEDQEGVDDATPVDDTPPWSDRPVIPPPVETPWWAAKESSDDKVEEPAPHLELVQSDPVAEDGLAQDAPAASSFPDPEQSQITPVGLPVRTPGVSFRDTDESMTSSAASKSGAIGIKSALTEFSDGRSLASQKLDEREEAEESADRDQTEGREE
jgi:CHASE3 domain sensor protein